MGNEHRAGALAAVLAAAVCFGTTGTVQALGAAAASPLSLGAVRIAIGGALLAAVAVIGRRRRNASGCGARAATGPAADVARPHLRLRTAVTIALGAAGVLGYQATFFAGTKANGVAVGTLIALGSAPIVTGTITWLVGKGFAGRRWLLATLAAIVGVGLLAGVGQPNASSVRPFGLLASLAAGGCYAVSTLASKKLLDAGWSSTGAMGAVFGAAGAVSALALPFTDLTWLATTSAVAAALWLGVVATALAYSAFGYGLARLPAPAVATLTLGEPLVATCLGALVLHEHVGLGQLAGIAVLLGSLLFLAWPARP